MLFLSFTKTIQTISMKREIGDLEVLEFIRKAKNSERARNTIMTDFNQCMFDTFLVATLSSL